MRYNATTEQEHDVDYQQLDKQFDVLSKMSDEYSRTLSSTLIDDLEKELLALYGHDEQHCELVIKPAIKELRANLRV